MVPDDALGRDILPTPAGPGHRHFSCSYNDPTPFKIGATGLTMLRLINRLANSRLVCFCVWLAFALWVWSILSDRGHKQLLIGCVVSIICGVRQVLRSI